MPRFYLPHKVSGETISLTDAEQLHHIRHVLRLQSGDEITIFDVDGNEYQCRIEMLGRDEALLRTQSRRQAVPKPYKLTLACAIPKKSLMDDIIDKLTQLGVDVIVPLLTERVIVKLEENAGSRLDRWQKIARSAAEQSRRNTLPVISGVTGLADLLANSKEYDLKLIPTLTGSSHPVRQVLSGIVPKQVLVLIGPEGDFTPREVDQALKAGFIPISLGNTTLRVETAAIALAAYLKLALPD